MEIPVEALLVLGGDPSPDLTDVQVTQKLEPRLYIVLATSARLQELAGEPGVRAVIRAGDRTPDDLDERETLFAEAWQLSQRQKVRPGDGLAWDAAGFTPPDFPGSIPPSRS
jgi:hypothetical protein